MTVKTSLQENKHSIKKIKKGCCRFVFNTRSVSGRTVFLNTNYNFVPLTQRLLTFLTHTSPTFPRCLFEPEKKCLEHFLG